MTLSGRRLAITRGMEDAAEFVGIVESEGGVPMPLPTIRLVGRSDHISGDYIDACSSYGPDYTVFMSSKAVGLLFDDAKKAGLLEEARLATANTVVVAVGPKTRDMLERHRIRVNLMPDSVFSSVGIGEVFGRLPRNPNRVLVPRSGASTPFLTELLNKEGFDVREMYLYDVEPQPADDRWRQFYREARGGRIDGMIFTSASSVRAFFEIMSGMGEPDAASLLGESDVVSIGPFTSEELEKAGLAHRVSPVHTVAGALEALRNTPE